MKHYYGRSRLIRSMSILAALSLILLIPGCGSSDDKYRSLVDSVSKTQNEQTEPDNKAFVTDETEKVTSDGKNSAFKPNEQEITTKVITDSQNDDTNDPVIDEESTVINYDEVYSAYAEIVKGKEKTLNVMFRNWNMDGELQLRKTVALYDIFEDETPELLLAESEDYSDIIELLSVYTYRNGKAELIYSKKADVTEFMRDYYYASSVVCNDDKSLFLYNEGTVEEAGDQEWWQLIDSGKQNEQLIQSMVWWYGDGNPDNYGETYYDKNKKEITKDEYEKTENDFKKKNAFTVFGFHREFGEATAMTYYESLAFLGDSTTVKADKGLSKSSAKAYIKVLQDNYYSIGLTSYESGDMKKSDSNPVALEDVTGDGKKELLVLTNDGYSTYLDIWENKKGGAVKIASLDHNFAVRYGPNGIYYKSKDGELFRCTKIDAPQYVRDDEYNLKTEYYEVYKQDKSGNLICYETLQKSHKDYVKKDGVSSKEKTDSYYVNDESVKKSTFNKKLPEVDHVVITFTDDKTVKELGKTYKNKAMSVEEMRKHLVIRCTDIKVADAQGIIDNKNVTDSQGDNVFATAKMGDIVKFGLYEQDWPENGKDPIEWIVLDKKSDEMLLLSKNALICKPYDTKIEGTK